MTIQYQIRLIVKRDEYRHLNQLIKVKNLVARLVSMFANHVELFNSTGCGAAAEDE